MSNSYELPKSPIPFLDGHQPLNLDHAHGGEPIVVKKTPNIMGLQQDVVKYE